MHGTVNLKKKMYLILKMFFKDLMKNEMSTICKRAVVV